MVTGLAAAAAAAVLFGLGALTQARASRDLEVAGLGVLAFVRVAVRHRLIWVTAAMYLAGFTGHVIAIQQLPLYLAQAGIALSLPVTVLGAVLLTERVLLGQWAGVVAVLAGLALLVYAAGETGHPARTWWFPVLLWVGVVLTLAPPLLGRAIRGPAVGALAGLAYAGCAIGVKGIDSLTDPYGLACATAVAAYGIGGFWLYSLALDRGSVSSATAPLVTAEVAGPAVVGLAVLGDEVREGWWPGLVLGVVLSVAGSALVAAHWHRHAEDL